MSDTVGLAGRALWGLARSRRALANRLFARYAYSVLGEAGPDLRICTPAQLNAPHSVRLGSNVFLGPGSSISAVGGLTIGDNFMSGPNLVISGGNHSLVPGERETHHDELNPPLTIGNDVWVGANVTILAGADIGDNTVVGAGSVVTKPLPPNSVCVGVPCRVIRELPRADGSGDGDHGAAHA